MNKQILILCLLILGNEVLAQIAEIPISFQGKWVNGDNRCDSIFTIEINAKSIESWATHSDIKNIEIDGNKITLDEDETFEGQLFLVKNTYILVDKNNLKLINNDGEIYYTRCH